MQAEIKRAWHQWWVAPCDGRRGGIPVANRKAALQLCLEHGWEPIEDPRDNPLRKIFEQ